MGTDQKTMNDTLSRVFKRLHYPVEVILVCVRWYVADPLSLRHLEEMMSERGVVVDHSTIHRWTIKTESSLIYFYAGPIKSSALPDTPGSG
jgi:putative transposase